MQLESALDHLLAPYMPQLLVRAGNGLTASMNAAIRSYPQVPQIIRRSADCLATLEYLFGLDGRVAVNCHDLYHILSQAHEDWHQEIPVLPPARMLDPALDDAESAARPVTFTRVPRLPRHQFTAAWSIARRIRLLTGWGSLRLHSEALAEFRRLLQTPGWYDKV